ncbi:hypothetical protein ACQKD6_00335 [Bacillus cereus]|uniref:hypothetical protein n=1 Tax=Bacillus cereus TaxID=1396 RepID=UPI003CFD4B72
MKAAVKHNISDFKEYLKSNDIYMEENIDENDGSVHFSAIPNLENGLQVYLMVAFQNDDPTVDIYCFNIVHVPNPALTADVLQVINELNTKYRFAKFTLNKNNGIDISTSLTFSEPYFNPAIVFEHTRGLFSLANENNKQLIEVILGHVPN